MSKNSICIKCNNQDTCGFCDLSCGTSRIATCICYTERKQTNADKLRAMNDEKLAELLTCNDGFCCPVKGADCIKEPSCTDCFLKWLKQEVDE